MVKQYWINLPVKNLAVSRDFFSKIGFSFDTKFESTDCLSLMVGPQMPPIMLFLEPTIESFANSKIADTSSAFEVLISFDAQSKEEVDQFYQKVVATGERIYSEPAEKDGWMYGFGFEDPDNHRWNMLYMDMEKLPKQ